MALDGALGRPPHPISEELCVRAHGDLPSSTRREPLQTEHGEGQSAGWPVSVRERVHVMTACVSAEWTAGCPSPLFLQRGKNMTSQDVAEEVIHPVGREGSQLLVSNSISFPLPSSLTGGLKILILQTSLWT